jgi:glycosyltransferase involved in cell wall biosynthesis
VRVSVIIPSYRGARKLPNVLEALCRQTYSPFEVIVALDGSADDSLAVLAAAEKPPVVVIKDSPNQSRSVTRNRGAQAATGDLLVFFDDDMRPAPDCVAVHVRHHEACKNAICGGAQLEEPAAMQSDFQHYKAHLSRKWTAPLAGCREPLSPDRLFLTAANFSIPAALFRQLGGFDERLTDAEDFDLAVRASCQGIPIYFRREAVAWHDDFITCRSYVKRLRQYQLAHGKLHQLKPDLYRKFDQYAYRPTGGLKKLAYHLTAAPWVVGLIEGGGLRVLPKKLRYKLYDIVTTGFAVHFPERAL